MFERYRHEVQELREYMLPRLAHLENMEDQLARMANSMRSNVGDPCLEPVTTSSQQATAEQYAEIIKLLQSNVEHINNNLKALQTDTETFPETFQQELLEPSILLEEGDNHQNHSERSDDDENSSSMNIPNSSTMDVDDGEGDEEADGEPDMDCELPSGLETNGNSAGNGDSIDCASSTNKADFLRCVQLHQSQRNLLKQNCSQNVCVLRSMNSHKVLGFQCAIGNCTYMHQLKAQVNRHIKNYHGKTCTECKARFKNEKELIEHLLQTKHKSIDLQLPNPRRRVKDEKSDDQEHSCSF